MKFFKIEKCVKLLLHLTLALSFVMAPLSPAFAWPNDDYTGALARGEVREVTDPYVKEIQKLAYDEKPSLRHLGQISDALKPLLDRIANSRKAIDTQVGGYANSRTGQEVLATMEQAMAVNDLFLEYRKSVFGRADTDAPYGEELEQKYEDVFNDVVYRVLDATFGTARHHVDQRGHIDGISALPSTLWRQLKEHLSDLTSIFQVWFSLDKGFYWAPRDRYVRERTSREAKDIYSKYFQFMLDDLKLYASDPALKYDRENHMQRTIGLFLWLTDRLVNIRGERDAAQRYARFTYWLPAFVLFVFPYLNYLGDAWSSNLETSWPIAAAFYAVYVVKGTLSSTKSTRAWVELNNQVRESVPPETIKALETYLLAEMNRRTNGREPYYPAVVPGWLDRDMRLREWRDDKLAPLKAFTGKRRDELLKLMVAMKEIAPLKAAIAIKDACIAPFLSKK